MTKKSREYMYHMGETSRRRGRREIMKDRCGGDRTRKRGQKRAVRCGGPMEKTDGTWQDNEVEIKGRCVGDRRER